MSLDILVLEYWFLFFNDITCYSRRKIIKCFRYLMPFDAIEANFKNVDQDFLLIY